MDHLGDPDFSLNGFSLWIHGWERDSAEFWDNNWLDVTAHFKRSGAMGSATVVVGGTILHSVDLEQAALAFAKLNDTLQGVAEFVTMDPGFEIKLEALSAGHVRFSLVMVPDVDELYETSAEIDQSYLSPAVTALQKLLAVYGPRGDRPKEASDST